MNKIYTFIDLLDRNHRHIFVPNYQKNKTLIDDYDNKKAELKELYDNYTCLRNNKSIPETYYDINIVGLSLKQLKRIIETTIGINYKQTFYYSEYDSLPQYLKNSYERRLKFENRTLAHIDDYFIIDFTYENETGTRYLNPNYLDDSINKKDLVSIPTDFLVNNQNNIVSDL